MSSLLSREQLEAALRRIGDERYHHLHPFHHRLNGGKLTKGQVQAWALNRYYYQRMIPLKDAAIVSRMDEAALRREWRQRIIDHDGMSDADGGLRRWLALTDGLGLDRDYVTSTEGVLPATKFAVEAYLHFVREKSVLEAIASSLTELFSPVAIGARVRGMLENYDYITPEILAYFDKRPEQATRDSDFALAYVLDNARRPDQQQDALRALTFKCNVLWAQLDALHHAYVEPGIAPPGAFRPEEE
ncbi:pyrroloquinoline-quinone synthase PqqC [Algihabitans albus]|uniref:pyrroloquinoline-quinone synthase PqqC n=1 Tax=Algihabitans albus TaxID=2164067 RepID=UPI000E5CAD2C|nr:pyrroloquinoline-quinone synthase PqqC [Algihabitans albus]